MPSLRLATKALEPLGRVRNRRRGLTVTKGDTSRDPLSPVYPREASALTAPNPTSTQAAIPNFRTLLHIVVHLTPPHAMFVGKA